MLIHLNKRSGPQIYIKKKKKTINYLIPDAWMVVELHQAKYCSITDTTLFSCLEVETSLLLQLTRHFRCKSRDGSRRRWYI